MKPAVNNNVKAVVFDFDGTLAETKINFARMRSLIVEHLKEWELFEEGCDEGRYILEIIAWAKQKLADRPDELACYDRETRQIMEQVELETCSAAHPFPGVAEALGRLSDRGYRIGIITRNCRAGVAAVLDRYHLHHEVLLTRDDLDRIKPDPEHLLAALQELDVEPREAVMVGDHPTDAQCAKAAGALSVGVLTDKTTKQQLIEAGADLVVDDVPALVAILCDHKPEAG